MTEEGQPKRPSHRMFDHLGLMRLCPRKTTQNTANVFYIIGKQWGMDSQWPLQRHRFSHLKVLKSKCGISETRPQKRQLALSSAGA